MEPDPLERDPTQTFAKVGEALDVGRSDGRYRHSCFHAVAVTSMHPAVIVFVERPGAEIVDLGSNTAGDATGQSARRKPVALAQEMCQNAPVNVIY
jgi:hypothetical protein